MLPRLTDALTSCSTMLAAADPGKDTALVKAEVSNLAFQIRTVSSMTNGLSAKILAYAPPDATPTTRCCRAPGKPS